MIKTMKYFLASLLICTVGHAAGPVPVKAYTIGTIEMWSAWMAGEKEVEREQICKGVLAAYNEQNSNRGYWGRLINPDPIRFVYRQTKGGALQLRFYCHLRVYKVISNEPRQ
jgi:hypothetical protein